MNFNHINTIVFDLGGVVIDIEPRKTFEAFSSITRTNLYEVEQLLKEKPLWFEHETGKISDQVFREEIRKNLKADIADKDIDDAYNALLLEIPPQRAELLKKLREKYQVLALSNTNSIHIHAFNNILKKYTDASHINELFHYTYYSFDIGHRKPDAKIFQHVIEQEKLKPEATLFLDDSEKNIKAAEAFGFHTLHVTPPHHINELLKDAIE